MKSVLCVALLLITTIRAYPSEELKKGFVCSMGFIPEFSYSKISSSMDDHQAWFSKYLGGAGVELNLGYSSTGTKISSFRSSFTWDYPTSLFAFSLFNGYAFTFLVDNPNKRMAYDFSLGFATRIVTGIKNANPGLGLKTGFKTGVEIKKDWFFWIGHSIDYEYRTVSVPQSVFNNPGAIVDYGTITASELSFCNRLFAALSYTF